MKKPSLISSCIAYRGFFQVQEDLLQYREATKSLSFLILPSDAAIVLATTPDNLYILNYEYRHPTGQFLLGCPGGLFESNENPLEAAKRELLEETGYFSNEIHFMGSAYPFPGVCSQKIHYFLAKNAIHQQKPSLDPSEIINVELKTHEELIHAIQTQSNIDAILCAALWYQEMFKNQKK